MDEHQDISYNAFVDEAKTTPLPGHVPRRGPGLPTCIVNT